MEPTGTLEGRMRRSGFYTTSMSYKRCRRGRWLGRVPAPDRYEPLRALMSRALLMGSGCAACCE